jgi:hypothetical protein
VWLTAAGVGQQQRVAVGGRLRDRFHANDSASAGTVSVNWRNRIGQVFREDRATMSLPPPG